MLVLFEGYYSQVYYRESQMLPRHCFAGVLGLMALLCAGRGYGAEPTGHAANAHSGVGAGEPSLGLPPLRPGMWEYQRTQGAGAGGKARSMTLRKCSNPNADFKQKLAQLKQKGCVFSPFEQSGQRYEASWRCPAPDGSIVAMHDVITVTSDTSYRTESDARGAHQATHSTIVATRQGDCSTSAPPTPAPAHPSVPGALTPPAPVSSIKE